MKPEMFRDREMALKARALIQRLAPKFQLKFMHVCGTHLATKTTLDDPTLRIRKMFGRPQKPFAIMAKDMPTINKIAYVSRDEKRLLESFRRPIVLLRKKDRALSSYVAPRLHNIGIMLPYSGIHTSCFTTLRNPPLL